MDEANKHEAIVEITSNSQLIGSMRRFEKALSKNTLPIHVITIVGDKMSGKSFFMNLLLNYLKHNNVRRKMNYDDGFKFGNRYGFTNGRLLVSPQIIPITTPNNKQVGIVLMECQGVFDGDLSETVNDLIFQIGTVLSSTIIYSTPRQSVSGADIDRILANTTSGYKGQRNLCFLFRDLPNHKKMDLATLCSTPDIANKLMQLEQYGPYSLYARALPYPGKDIKYFKGDMRKLIPEFLDKVEEVCDLLKGMVTGAVEMPDFRQKLIDITPLKRHLKRELECVKHKLSAMNTVETLVYVHSHNSCILKNCASLRRQLTGQPADLPIHIITVAGQAKTGKSTFLHLLAAYLKNNGNLETMKTDETELEKYRDPNGSNGRIIIHPELFIRQNSDGKNVGILLLECEGVFDNDTDTKSLQLWQITRLLSSTVVYNTTVNETFNSTLKFLHQSLNVQNISYVKINPECNLRFTFRDCFEMNHNSELLNHLPLIMKYFNGEIPMHYLPPANSFTPGNVLMFKERMRRVFEDITNPQRLSNKWIMCKHLLTLLGRLTPDVAISLHTIHVELCKTIAEPIGKKTDVSQIQPLMKTQTNIEAARDLSQKAANKKNQENPGTDKKTPVVAESSFTQTGVDCQLEPSMSNEVVGLKVIVIPTVRERVRTVTLEDTTSNSAESAAIAETEKTNLSPGNNAPHSLTVNMLQRQSLSANIVAPVSPVSSGGTLSTQLENNKPGPSTVNTDQRQNMSRPMTPAASECIHDPVCQIYYTNLKRSTIETITVALQNFRTISSAGNYVVGSWAGLYKMDTHHQCERIFAQIKNEMSEELKNLTKDYIVKLLKVLHRSKLRLISSSLGTRSNTDSAHERIVNDLIREIPAFVKDRISTDTLRQSLKADYLRHLESVCLNGLKDALLQISDYESLPQTNSRYYNYYFPANDCLNEIAFKAKLVELVTDKAKPLMTAEYKKVMRAELDTLTPSFSSTIRSLHDTTVTKLTRTMDSINRNQTPVLRLHLSQLLPQYLEENDKKQNKALMAGGTVAAGLGGLWLLSGSSGSNSNNNGNRQPPRSSASSNVQRRNEVRQSGSGLADTVSTAVAAGTVASSLFSLFNRLSN